MAKLLTIFLINSLFVSVFICFKNRNILFNEFHNKNQSLIDLTVWRNQLKDEFKTNLNKLPDTVKTAIIETADQELKLNWTALTAMDYLEYKLNGTRVKEGKFLIRDKRIMTFALARLLTGKDQYLHEVVNGLWLTLEESTWVLPAHLTLQKAGVGLPDPTQPIVDLGDGQRAAYVAWLGLIMGDQLSKVSPMLTKRIDYELNHRLFEPYMKYEYWWSGLEGQSVNNWNIWINTNTLMSALLNLNQPERLAVINRTVKSADDWINWYGDDGGCDEGPSYWGGAGAQLLKFIYYISSASGKQMNWSSNQMVNNIGTYIYKMHIDRDYFVNFADAHPRMIADPSTVFTFGQITNNVLMKQFGAYLYQLAGNQSYLISNAIGGYLHGYDLQLATFPLLMSTTPKAPQPRESWFPDLQVITMRSLEGSAKGLFIGAKAGNNGESHNHNDVGNFVLYVNGLPALIDVGSPTYTSLTFSKDRYTIWNLQSQWHNCPTINGQQQHDGRHMAAKNVSYSTVPNGGEFVADIAGAYPEAAHVKSWVRTLAFDRTSDTLNLTETYSLTEFVEPFKIHFITSLNATLNKSTGHVILDDNTTKLVMNYEPNLFDVVLDRPNNTDQAIILNWHNRISRVTLVSKQKQLDGKHTIKFNL